MKKTTHLLMLLFITNAYCADQNLPEDNALDQSLRFSLTSMRASLESSLGTEEAIRDTVNCGIKECENHIKILDRQLYAYRFLLQSRTKQNSMQVVLTVVPRGKNDELLKKELEETIKSSKELLTTSSTNRLREEANKAKKEVAQNITALEQDKSFLKGMEDTTKASKDVPSTDRLKKEAPEQTKEKIEKEIASIKLKESSYKHSLTISTFHNRSEIIDTIIVNLVIDQTKTEYLEGKIAAIEPKQERFFPLQVFGNKQKTTLL